MGQRRAADRRQHLMTISVNRVVFPLMFFATNSYAFQSFRFLNTRPERLTLPRCVVHINAIVDICSVPLCLQIYFICIRFVTARKYIVPVTVIFVVHFKWNGIVYRLKYVCKPGI